MLRSLYRCALRLHPPAFRKRFADEMLSILDHTKGRRPRYRLLMDAVLSLLRQWTIRSEFWNDVSTVPSRQVAPDGLPSFSSLDPFRPRASAVVHGVVLTTTLFLLTCFAIRYSWINVLHVHIPAFEFESSSSIHPSASPSELRGMPALAPAKNAASATSPQVDTTSAHLYVEPLPVEAEDTAGVTTRSTSKIISSSKGTPVTVLTTLQIRLQSYTGTYTSTSPRVAISVWIRGDRLVVEVDDEPARPLSPLSSTTFVVEGSNDCELQFASESDGKFHRLRLSEPARQITAQRQ